MFYKSIKEKPLDNVKEVEKWSNDDNMILNTSKAVI